MKTQIFSNIVRELLDKADEQQAEIDKAGGLIYESMKNGGLFHVFCTGHSHMIAEEFFYRAGGLIPVNPLLSPFLMQHEGAVSSTKYERLSDVVEELIKMGKNPAIFKSIHAKDGQQAFREALEQYAKLGY